MSSEVDAGQIGWIPAYYSHLDLSHLDLSHLVKLKLSFLLSRRGSNRFPAYYYLIKHVDLLKAPISHLVKH